VCVFAVDAGFYSSIRIPCCLGVQKCDGSVLFLLPCHCIHVSDMLMTNSITHSEALMPQMIVVLMFFSSSTCPFDLDDNEAPCKGKLSLSGNSS